MGAMNLSSTLRAGRNGKELAKPGTRRLDLRHIGAEEACDELVAGLEELSPGHGMSFLAVDPLARAREVVVSSSDGDFEWFALEEGPRVWDVVVGRRQPGVSHRQVLEFMKADHFRIDDLLARALHQAELGRDQMTTTCRDLAAALRRHIKMEDDVLLPVVAERLAGSRPPVRMLRDAHHRLEGLLDQMCRVGETEEVATVRSRKLGRLADDLEEVLLSHIGVEERVLYAVTDLLATSAERDELVRRCRATGADLAAAR